MARALAAPPCFAQTARTSRDVQLTRTRVRHDSGRPPGHRQLQLDHTTRLRVRLAPAADNIWQRLVDGQCAAPLRADGATPPLCAATAFPRAAPNQPVPSTSEAARRLEARRRRRYKGQRKRRRTAPNEGAGASRMEPTGPRTAAEAPNADETELSVSSVRPGAATAAAAGLAVAAGNGTHRRPHSHIAIEATTPCRDRVLAVVTGPRASVTWCRSSKRGSRPKLGLRFRCASGDDP
jgi:hypothetical protein